MTWNFGVFLLTGHESVLPTGYGGRIWTSERWAGAPMDLGASWIHGIEDNPITAKMSTAS